MESGLKRVGGESKSTPGDGVPGGKRDGQVGCRPAVLSQDSEESLEGLPRGDTAWALGRSPGLRVHHAASAPVGRACAVLLLE